MKQRKMHPITEIIKPTPERAQHGLGVRENNHRFSVIQPIEWLFERGALGQKDSREAGERLNAARYYLFLYILAEERPNRAAMLNWSKFMLGLGSTSFQDGTKEDYEIFLLAKKREYIRISNELTLKGSFGRFGVLILRGMCRDGFAFKEMEKRLGFTKGMAGIMLRYTLDDLKKIAGL